MDLNFFIYEGKLYKVNYIRKKIKNIIFHFNENTFNISLPYKVSERTAYQLLNEFGPKLIKRKVIRNFYIENKYIYLFGEKRFRLPNDKYFIFNKYISFKSLDDFYKKIKLPFLAYLTERTSYFKKIMNISYNPEIKVRNMKTKYGVNFKSKNILTFSYVLVHYPKDVIDSVIIHELAHYFYLDHSKNFYEIVYKYCPNYNALREVLDKGEFL